MRKAPDFTTRGAIAGKVVTVHLAEQLKKGPVVLYFFPAAYTGGCNAEAHAFAEAIPAFTKAGATVIGMSADNVDTLSAILRREVRGQVRGRERRAERSSPATTSRSASRWPGRDITKRTSYVIAKDGRIAFVHDDMNPAAMSQRRWRQSRS